MRLLRILAVMVALSFLHTAVAEDAPTNMAFPIPARGLVPDAIAAVKIAEAVLVGLFGDEILQERPFNAELHGDEWYVNGTMHGVTPGGTAFISIAKRDGRVTNFFRSK